MLGAPQPRYRLSVTALVVQSGEREVGVGERVQFLAGVRLGGHAVAYQRC